ncbi:thioredoxin family protein [Taibaiella soli]|uniref:Thioredoxin family protein n=1 Tax=Taibaiella soli TaxID=1649169 RepID=A0A2W2B4Z5_9BACT|nr:thioredoxin family protein [Taibaiella soli]PZF71157.1 thioredoxin family protein [Taibaiella soli]
MKRISILIAAVMLSGAGFVYAQKSAGTKPAAAQEAKQSIEIGSQLPAGDLSMLATDKKRYTLNEVKTKKGLLVMFSCNTCPYVIKSQPRTKEMMELARKEGIGMIVINSNATQRGDQDSYEAMTKYSEQQGYNVPYVVDEGPVVTAFGASHTPEVFLFDGTGRLVYKGAMEDSPADPGKSTKMYLKDAMTNMVANKAINPQSTRSIGCSIKIGS